MLQSLTSRGCFCVLLLSMCVSLASQDAFAKRKQHPLRNPPVVDDGSTNILVPHPNRPAPGDPGILVPHSNGSTSTERGISVPHASRPSRDERGILVPHHVVPAKGLTVDRKGDMKIDITVPRRVPGMRLPGGSPGPDVPDNTPFVRAPVQTEVEPIAVPRNANRDSMMSRDKGSRHNQFDETTHVTEIAVPRQQNVFTESGMAARHELTRGVNFEVAVPRSQSLQSVPHTRPRGMDAGGLAAPAPDAVPASSAREASTNAESFTAAPPMQAVPPKIPREPDWQSMSPLERSLTVLEHRVFKHDFSTEDSETRLQRLERFVFGGVHAGDSNDRLKKLSRVLLSNHASSTGATAAPNDRATSSDWVPDETSDSGKSPPGSSLSRSMKY